MLTHSLPIVIALVCVGRGVSDDPKPKSADPDRERVERLLAFLEGPTVTLGKVPMITLEPRSPVTKEEAARIKALIASFSQIDKPDFGLSRTMSGQAFAPLPGRKSPGAMLLTDHKIQPSGALRALVELGPRALPFLLESLDDETPTKLKMEHYGAIGVMSFANELWGNPVSEHEQKLLRSRPKRESEKLFEEAIETYTVKVGDVCLVAIGQIVGRPYQAVRYQPTACIVINSPTHDKKLCEQVRAIWSGDNPERKLFESLLIDYSTRGIFNGESLDGWATGSELQIEAALRLMYYFPKESVPLIVERLRSLDVRKTGPGRSTRATEEQLEAYIKREVANGVRADDFIKAVSWSKEPGIQGVLADIAKRTDDSDILKAIKGQDR